MMGISLVSCTRTTETKEQWLLIRDQKQSTNTELLRLKTVIQRKTAKRAGLEHAGSSLLGYFNGLFHQCQQFLTEHRSHPQH